MPGTDFHMTALGRIDTLKPSLSGFKRTDYSGSINLAMTQRWSNLSRSAQTVGKVLDLIWTDSASNLVVGTKGCAANTDAVIERAVIASRLRIRYELPYAVPAVVVLGILALITALTFLALLLRRTSLSKMARYLNATSAGRIMTAVLQPPTQTVGNDSLTTDWVRRDGRADILVGRNRPVLVSTGPHDPSGALLGGEEAAQGKLGNVTASSLTS
ncbi:hypothetical protein BJY00DRAFT_310479 [Aspergillus carlsbadensis]|nr:hypothetical protein BJY00DRAFT_310479 [Aspergillus carlsbadensis]